MSRARADLLRLCLGMSLAAYAGSAGAAPGDSALAIPQTAVAGSGLQMNELLDLRDPFRPKAFQGEAAALRGALENFPSDAFKMVGVVTGPNRARAVLVDPDGHTHFVAVNAKIGIRNGSVVSIQEDKILVREKIANVFGNLEEVETQIPLEDATSRSKGGGGSGSSAGRRASMGGGGGKGGGGKGGGGGGKGGGGKGGGARRNR